MRLKREKEKRKIQPGEDEVDPSSKKQKLTKQDGGGEGNWKEGG